MSLREMDGILVAAPGAEVCSRLEVRPRLEARAVLEARRVRLTGASLAFVLAGLGCIGGMQTGAQPTEVSGKLLEPITVTARKEPIATTDEEVTKQVEAALRANPYVFDSHVSITTKDGVVTLSGMVLDVWDVFTLKRIVRKMAGVKKVVDQLDLELGGD
jgi:BON domain